MKRGKEIVSLSSFYSVRLLACTQSAPKSFDSKREEEFTNCLFYKLQMLLTPEADAEPKSALRFFLLLWPVSRVWDDFHHFYWTR